MQARLSVFLLVIFSPLLALAQPLSDRVPAEAIIYIGWQGSESMPASFNQSHAKALLDDSNIPKVFNDMIPQLIRRLGMENPQAGEHVKLMAGIVATFWRHPTAIYSTGVDFNAPAPHAALICNAGNEADALAEQLGKLAAIMQAGNIPFPVRPFKDGTIVGLTLGYADEKLAVAADASKSLSASPTFKAAIAQAQKEPIAILYADTAAILDTINQGNQLFGNEQDKIIWPKVRDALGLPGLKRLICTGAFDGPDWATQCFIEAPAPRIGIVKLLEGKPATDDLLRAIPATASFAAAGSFDLAKFMAEVRSVAGNIDPQAQAMFDKGIGAAGLFVQMNLQKDFFEALGSEWAIYMNPAATGNGPFGLTVVNRLAKPLEADRALGKIELVADNMINAQLQQQKMTIGFNTTKVGATTIHYVAVPFVSPSWAIADGNLYLGLYPQMVAEAASHVSSKGKSLLDNPSFTALRKKLGADKATGFAYSDLPQTINNSYQLLLMISQSAVGMGELAGVKGPAMVLPPLSKFRQHLAPAAQFCWTDDAGWHARSSSPFPCAELLGSQSGMVMSLPMGAAVIMPAIVNQRARAAARPQAMNNLKQIGIGIMMYANAHNGQYPADFGPLLTEARLPLDIFISPHAGTQIPAEIRAGKPDEQAAWINSRSDYVYLAADLKPNAGPGLILAYERPDGRPGMNVLFTDGHVEWIDVDSARLMIEKQQKLAAK